MFGKHEEPSLHWGKAAFCFFAGAAVGAAVSALYTPQSGDETRARIADKTFQLKDKVTEAAEHMADRIHNWRGNSHHETREPERELQNA